MSKRVALVEQIDDVVYVLNGPEPILVGPTENLVHTNLIVEAWFADSQRMLSLKGDYLCHYSEDMGREVVHISLIDLTDEPCIESDDGKTGIIDKFRALRREVLRLITYRDYLEGNRISMTKLQLPGFDVEEGESMLDAQDRFHRGRSQRIQGDNIALQTKEAKFIALTEVIIDPVRSRIAGTPETHITRIQGTFLDHTILSLDLASKLVYVLTPDRDSLEFHVDECLSREDQVAGDLLTAKYTKSSVRMEGPSPTIVRHVRSLIAFYRWARAPVRQREAIVDEGIHVSKVAQAAAMHSHRHLLLLKLRLGHINRKSAMYSSEILESSLAISGRDGLNGCTPFPYTGLIRDIDGSRKSTVNNFVNSLTPKTVYSAVAGDPAKEKHAHLHYINMRNVAREALMKNSSFLEREKALLGSAQKHATTSKR